MYADSAQHAHCQMRPQHSTMTALRGNGRSGVPPRIAARCVLISSRRLTATLFGGGLGPADRCCYSSRTNVAFGAEKFQGVFGVRLRWEQRCEQEEQRELPKGFSRLLSSAMAAAAVVAHDAATAAAEQELEEERRQAEQAQKAIEELQDGPKDFASMLKAATSKPRCPRSRRMAITLIVRIQVILDLMEFPLARGSTPKA